MTKSTQKQYFTIEEALSDIKNTLENGYDDYLCDLHNKVFNADYYIIGTYKAQQALNQYDVWQAFEEIQEYENDHFGKVLTDISNPEHVANQLYYLKGQEAIGLIQENNELLDDKWNEKVTEETAKSLIQTITILLDENLKLFMDDMNWVVDYNSSDINHVQCAIEIYNSVGEMEITEYKQRLEDDTIMFSDVNLTALIAYYLDANYSMQDINSHDGINFYYCKENDTYLVTQ